MTWFTEKKYVIVIALFSCFLWGSAFPVLKISYDLLDLSASDFNSKIAFASLRFLIAGLALWIVSKGVLKLDMSLNRASFVRLLTLGIFNTSLLYFFFYNGLANTSGIKAAILQSISTFLIVIVSHFVYDNDHLTLRKVAGLVFGFLGIVIVNFNSGFGGFSFKWIGEGFMILAGISGTIGTLMAKSAGQKIHPFKVTTYQMIFGAIILMLVGFVRGGFNSLHFTPLSGSLLLYAAFISATAFSLWFSLLKFNKASEITLYKFTIPIVGSLLSAILLQGEVFSPIIFFGLASVSFGLYIVNSKRVDHKGKRSK